MAGYSEKPLHQKLGIKEGMNVLVLDAPDEYFDRLGEDCPPFFIQDNGVVGLDFVHLFTNSKDTLKQHLEHLRNNIKANGMVWVSWYKKAAKLPTEITEDIIREIALPLDWVDVKVCAVSEQWSGLKLVIMKDKR